MPLSAVSHMVNAFLWLNMPIWSSVYDECRVRKPNVNEVEPYIVDVFIVCVRVCVHYIVAAYLFPLCFPHWLAFGHSFSCVFPFIFDWSIVSFFISLWLIHFGLCFESPSIISAFVHIGIKCRHFQHYAENHETCSILSS